MRTAFPRLRPRLAGALLALAAACAHAVPTAGPRPERISLPGPAGAALTAYWLPAAGEGRHPAVLALHGCGGLYAKDGGLSERFREAAERLHAQGYAVLLPDSFGSRGVRQVCQTRYAERSVHVPERARDARAALAWLAAQPQVDAQRLGLLGWSNGASTVLAVLEQRRAQPAPAEPPIAGAAVFYPGCGPLERRQAALESVPLLMQLGALDDWTPPQPCIDLAHRLQAQPGSDVTLHVHAGSYHGFDAAAPVRVRTDVPNGAAGGVHQGGNPEARVRSLAALDTFWSRVLRPRAAMTLDARAHFCTLARYNVWATARLLDAVAGLPEQDYRRDAGLFFKSIHGTLNHLLVGEHRLWFVRFATGESPRLALDAELEEGRARLDACLREGAARWEPLIASWPAGRWSATLDYTTTRGTPASLPFAAALAHVFHHGTHHRGQITAALTALGRPCPELDLVYYLQNPATP